VSQLIFAYGAGMLATVNPCGFAMLPAFLAYYVAAGEAVPQTTARRLIQAMGVGLAVSAGFAGVFTVAGLLVAAGLRSLVGAVPWVAVVIGIVLVLLGAAMVTGRQIGVRVNATRLTGPGVGVARMAAFGAAYALASLSCTLAVLLAVVAQALATASLAGTVAVFIAYGAGAGTVLVLLALSAAVVSEVLARGLRRLLPMAGRLGGAVLALSGAYLVAYWAPVLFGNRSETGLSKTGGRLSGSLASLIADHQGLVIVLAAFPLIAAALATLRSRGAEASSSSRAVCAPAASASSGSTSHPKEKSHRA